MRKLSDCESIGKKLATLPRYQEPVDRHRLQPQYSLTLGKSDETLTKSEKLGVQAVTTVSRSFNNVSESNPGENKSNLSDDEIARRNKHTVEQLQGMMNMNSKLLKRTNENNAKVNVNPPIRIKVEDTTKVCSLNLFQLPVDNYVCSIIGPVGLAEILTKFC